MLPDFPESRREIDAHNALEMHLRALAKSPVRAVGSSITQHEGVLHSHEQVTPSGTSVVTEGFEEVRVPFEIAYDEIPKLMGDKLAAKIEQIADGVAREQSRLLFSKLDEVTRSTGNAIDAAGRPPSKEMWLSLLEGLEMDFDPETRRPKLTFIAHPVMVETMQKLSVEWETDRDFVKKREEILSRKFEEWRDRESCRKLVD